MADRQRFPPEGNANLHNGIHDPDVWANPFVHYRSKAKPTERIFLTQEEPDTIAFKDFCAKRLTQVRDIFYSAAIRDWPT